MQKSAFQAAPTRAGGQNETETCNETDPAVGFASSTQPGVLPALLVMVLVLSACTSLITTCTRQRSFQRTFNELNEWNGLESHPESRLHCASQSTGLEGAQVLVCESPKRCSKRCLCSEHTVFASDTD